MAGFSTRRFRISAIGGTSVTLVPAAGESLATDIAGGVTSIVINTPGTPDTRVFDVVNREFIIDVESR